jgi:8-oxo-dGTP pyrophosphatase MutT (NUDIX family)
MIDTVAWVHLEDGRILCARPRGKDVFYVPGGKREGGESDLQTLLREIAEELTVALRPETVRHAGTYQADHPDGTVVLMSCYTRSTPVRWPPAARSTSWPGSVTPTGRGCRRSTGCCSTTSTRPAGCAESQPARTRTWAAGNSFHQCA